MKKSKSPVASNQRIRVLGSADLERVIGGSHSIVSPRDPASGIAQDAADTVSPRDPASGLPTGKRM